MLEIELEREFYTPGQLAKQLCKNRRTIIRWLQAGKLRGVPINGRWTIRRADIFQFLAQQRDAAAGTSS